MQALSLLNSPLVTHVCRAIKQNGTLNALSIEVFGINLPKVINVRNKDEAIDSAVLEFGNTIGYFGGVFGGSVLLDKLFNKLGYSSLKQANLPFLNQTRVMKSMALLVPLTTFMLAMPFFRNAYTTWRSQTTDFKQLICKSRLEQKQACNKQDDVNRMIRQNRNKGLLICGVGAALGLLGSLWAGSGKIGLRMFKNSSQLTSFFNAAPIRKTLSLLTMHGKNATGLSTAQALLFWGAPCYAGCILASRDRFEVKEQALKMINFMLVFALPAKIMQLFFKNKTRMFATQEATRSLYQSAQNEFLFHYPSRIATLSKAMQQAVRFENLKLMTSLGITILLMGVIPTRLNIHLTRERLKRAAEEEAEQKAKQQPYPLYPNNLISSYPMTSAHYYQR